MARPPWFPLYPTDFLADDKVSAMTTEEVGAYWLLLCYSWYQTPQGSIPDDDKILAGWTRSSPQGWAAIKKTVLSPFTLGSDGRHHQKRLKAEAKRIAQKSKAQSDKARKRWDRPVKPDATAMPQHAPGIRTGTAPAHAEGMRSDQIRSDQKKPKDPSHSGNGLKARWPTWLIPIRDLLKTLGHLEGFNDPNYWKRISVRCEESGVAYMDSLTKYITWHESRAASRRHKNVQNGFRRWIEEDIVRARNRKAREPSADSIRKSLERAGDGKDSPKRGA